MKRFVQIVIVLFWQIVLLSQSANDSFIRGVDISFTPQIEDLGGKYKVNGIEQNVLDIFKDKGVNYIRLRLWHTPIDGYCGLEKTIEFAKRIKSKNLKLLLDFHYSDWWADPGKQNKPAAWQSLTYNSLLDSIYSYTYYVIKAFDTLGILPEMVQVGNEIPSGFLWPEGRVGGSYENQWQQFTSLLKKAINAVHDASSDTIKIMIHIDRGGNNNLSRWFYDNLKNYAVNYDVIGLSYYPWWHGTLTALKQNVNDLALRYNKEIIVAETAYPWTLQWFDNTSNIVGNSSQLHNSYPASVEGQHSFLYDLFQIVKEIPNKKGAGVFYWAPEYISIPNLGSPWENVALFDFQENALNSMRVFNEKENDTSNAINVTFNLNTATNFDTLTSSGFVQLRGEVIDKPDVLASGEKISWDINSEVILQNVYGDYWQTTVRITPGTEIYYKYWTGHSKNKPTFLRLGSEGPIQSSFRKFVAGTADTILPVEYYNSTSTTLNQYWSPFSNYIDSIGVLFRANIGDLVAKGLFDPNKNFITVRGDSVNSASFLSWSKGKTLLREEASINNGSFWSAVIYFPKNKILTGTEIKYKFYVENTSFGGWESSINDRTFLFPTGDTTLVWHYFNDKKNLTDVGNNSSQVAGEFRLFQNYPNPFNSSTIIKYLLPIESYILLQVFNSLGQLVKTLESKTNAPGEYSIIWDGKDELGNSVVSGIYFINLQANNKNQFQKVVLLK